MQICNAVLLHSILYRLDVMCASACCNRGFALGNFKILRAAAARHFAALVPMQQPAVQQRCSTVLRSTHSNGCHWLAARRHSRGPDGWTNAAGTSHKLKSDGRHGAAGAACTAAAGGSVEFSCRIEIATVHCNHGFLSQCAHRNA